MPPSITAVAALKRLERILARMQEVIKSRSWSRTHTLITEVTLILSEFYGEKSKVKSKFESIYVSANPTQFNLENIAEFVEARVFEIRDQIDHAPVVIDSPAPLSPLPSKPASSISASSNTNPKKIFVVHGHEHGTKETVARFLEKLGLEPIILHEQTDQGQTILEKFVAHASEARCAVILLTADDIGGPKATPAEQLQSRARQNVILEFGYFAGRLGRDHTFALVQPGVELPSDLNGLVYIPLRSDNEWRFRLVKELRAAGLDVDANHAF